MTALTRQPTRFDVSVWGQKLVEPYPDPRQWSLDGVTRDDIRRFVSLWLVEGIPFAFRDKPMIYEHAREFIARRVNERSRQITVIGSARLGYSLAAPKFGRAFVPAESDLDAVILSERTFAKLQAEFSLWRDLYTSGKLGPVGAEAKYWDENLRVVPSTLGRGFIDTNKIPNRSDFPMTRRVNDTRWLVAERINEEAGRQICKKIGFRVYKDWESAICQMALTVEAAFKKVAIAKSAIAK